MLIDWSKKTITTKVLVDGPSGVDKTPFLRAALSRLEGKTPPPPTPPCFGLVGKTAFFDFWGDEYVYYHEKRYNLKLLMYYCREGDFVERPDPNSWKMRGADGVIFVTDASVGHEDAATRLGEIREYFGVSWGKVPFIVTVDGPGVGDVISVRESLESAGFVGGTFVPTVTGCGAGVAEAIYVFLGKVGLGTPTKRRDG